MIINFTSMFDKLNIYPIKNVYEEKVEKHASSPYYEYKVCYIVFHFLVEKNEKKKDFSYFSFRNTQTI